MAELIFRYGAMGSSKTANALMLRFSYLERGKEVLLLKPSIENRDGKKTIRSRIGIEAECIFVEDYLCDYKSCKPDIIIVDEAQFLSSNQVEKLAHIVDETNVNIICYGLKTDFQSKMFEGSKRLFELADKLEELETVCWCGNKARYNARIIDGKVVKDGEQIFLGGNEAYIALCRKHFFKGKLK